MSQQNVQTIQGLYGAFNRGDFETLEQGFARQFERYEPEGSLYAEGNPFRSFSALREGLYKPRSRDFTDFRTEVEQILDAGDFVVVSGRYRGKAKATGKELSSQFCHLIHLDQSGKVDRFHSFTNTLHEAQVTGKVEQIARMKIPQPAM